HVLGIVEPSSVALAAEFADFLSGLLDRHVPGTSNTVLHFPAPRSVAQQFAAALSPGVVLRAGIVGPPSCRDLGSVRTVRVRFPVRSLLCPGMRDGALDPFFGLAMETDRLGPAATVSEARAIGGPAQMH